MSHLKCAVRTISFPRYVWMVKVLMFGPILTDYARVFAGCVYFIRLSRFVRLPWVRVHGCVSITEHAFERHPSWQFVGRSQIFRVRGRAPIVTNNIVCSNVSSSNFHKNRKSPLFIILHKIVWFLQHPTKVLVNTPVLSLFRTRCIKHVNTYQYVNKPHLRIAHRAL